LIASLALGAGMEVAGVTLPLHRIEGVDYLSLARVCEAAGARFWRVAEQGVSGEAYRFVVVLPADSARPEREYVFRPDSAFVRGPGREIALPFAPRLDGEQLFVPVIALSAVLPELSVVLPQLFLAGVYDAADTLVIRLGANSEPVPSASGARPRNTKPAALVWHGNQKSSLEYRLAIGARCGPGTQEEFALIPILASNGLVQSVALAGGAGTELVVTFRKSATVQIKEERGELVMRCWPRPARRVRRIVLDPGHGGEDPGAVGPAGTQEKTVVLDIATKLRTKLEAEGYEVLLTRSEDVMVKLSERSKFANAMKADLFVSIHANAATNRQANGFETFFLSEAKSDWDRTVAARENAALEFEDADVSEMTDELELILTDLAQNEFVVEASKLAAAIQQQTVPAARVNDRGVRQANFFVLRNNYMPAVLVEVGFLSNKSEEKLLLDMRHRERLVEGIAQGIVEFARRYERRVNGS